MSLCEQSKISSSGSHTNCDRRKTIPLGSTRKYILNNPEKQLVCKTLVDQGLIPDSKVKKCDYALTICSNLSQILVELKGRHLEEACTQIISTIYRFKQLRILGSTVFARIILSKNRIPNYKNIPEYLKLRKTLLEINKQLVKDDILVKNIMLSEPVSKFI